MNAPCTLVVTATFLLTLTTLPLPAQLVTYDFEVDVATPASVGEGIAASELGLNAGSVTYAAGSSGRAISGANWLGAPGEKYWEFTLQVNPGVSFDLASLGFDYRSTLTGPSEWALTINGEAAGSGTLLTDAEFHSLNLDLTAFADLPSAEFRLTGSGGATAAGAWRLDNVILNGSLTVTPVPEPSTWALLGGGLLFLAGRWRHRWKRK
jgi:hypothetical protein